MLNRIWKIKKATEVHAVMRSTVKSNVACKVSACHQPKNTLNVWTRLMYFLGWEQQLWQGVVCTRRTGKSSKTMCCWLPWQNNACFYSSLSAHNLEQNSKAARTNLRVFHRMLKSFRVPSCLNIFNASAQRRQNALMPASLSVCSGI